MYRILVVEDERPINDLIEMNLTEAGYSCVCAYDGLEAANLLEKESFDLVLLDIMLPKVSGYELLDFIKPLGIPVIFLTAKGTMADKVKGLRLGADDYLVKPFEIVELLARVEAVLRRAGKSITEISIGGLTIDTRSHTVTRGSRHRADGQGVRAAAALCPQPQHRPLPRDHLRARLGQRVHGRLPHRGPACPAPAQKAALGRQDKDDLQGGIPT